MDSAMRKTLLIAAFFMFSGMVQAPSISVSPSTLDLGEVEDGETYEYNLYVTPRDTGGPVEITPTVEGAFFSTMFNNSEVNENRVSQQDISPWIDFRQESFVVDPSETNTYEARNGESVKAAARIPMELKVPEDAEPGFHATRIGFSAEGVGDNQGFATSNWVLPFITVTMEVPGNAEREISMEDAQFLRIGENQAQIITMLHNTGTVTTEFEGATVDILNDEGQKVGEVQLNSATLQPDEYQEVDAVWQSGSLEPGTYELSGTGDYITGRFFIGAQGSIEQAIQDRVEIEDPSGESTGEGSDMPTWLVAMIIMLLAVIMYSFDIDPLWIVLIIGLVSISAFVIITGLPLYVIAITLILGVLMIYYGLI